MKWGPFGDAAEPDKLSMTRIVAFMFAASICFGIVRMSIGGTLGAIGWPFCALGVVTLLAVPLQAFFKFFNTWLKTKPGNKLMAKIAERGAELIGVSPGATTTTTVNVDAAPEGEAG